MCDKVKWADYKFPPINLLNVWPYDYNSWWSTINMMEQMYVDERMEALNKLKSKPKKEFLSKLINDHWNYIQGVLVQDSVHLIDIDRIGYHYKTAFEHGWKHAEEYHNVN